MVKWVHELATGQFSIGGPFDPPFDPATQGLVEYPENPNVRTERYDGTAETKKRAATVQELAAFDAALVDKVTAGKIDGDKVTLALAEFVRQELNTIRAALPIPLPNITRNAALAAIRTIYKAIP